jgi:replicative DNA helicase
MRADNQKGNREQEIASISRGLKGIAKDLNIPVLALSQLSRAVDSRDDHRPTLSDLRESGAIEQDADVVLFPYREEYYEKDKSNIDPAIEGITELILAKHRNGALETVTVRCDMKTSRFLDLDSTTAQASDAGYQGESNDDDPF